MVGCTWRSKPFPIFRRNGSSHYPESVKFLVLGFFKNQTLTAKILFWHSFCQVKILLLKNASLAPQHFLCFCKQLIDSDLTYCSRFGIIVDTRLVTSHCVLSFFLRNEIYLLPQTRCWNYCFLLIRLFSANNQKNLLHQSSNYVLCLLNAVQHQRMSGLANGGQHVFHIIFKHQMNG